MQMRNCDDIGHVTALDPSEPSTHMTRSAPGDNITAKQCLKGDNRGLHVAPPGDGFTTKRCDLC